MNRWSVYEHLKRRFMETGSLPPLEEVLEEFSGLDFVEIAEGIEEFNAAISWPGGAKQEGRRPA
ncbi:hypothetical protein [Staphylospora marina]|uniref:hypothetical protein n=1 Tax=Staphylospora marina TaxID=2490858 RepID=UPI000F5B9F79|nr:hypothetical protein [Staphylospora marina]